LALRAASALSPPAPACHNDFRTLAGTDSMTSSHDDPTAIRPNAAPPDADPDATLIAPTDATAGDADATLLASRPGATPGTTLLIDQQVTAERPAGDLAVGTLLKDRFVIEGLIGRGGMGVVYRARDLRKEETGDRDPFVALKVLNDQFRRNPRMVVALQREARKAQTLAHPNIATVYDFDRDDNVVYLTMEELTGRPLDDVIKAAPEGLERERALKILRGLCLGLAYAHNKNIVHSDFKPGNVFLTERDEVRILDFGIARAAPAANLNASETTHFDAGELGALTPSYASSEMFNGATPHPADDVYALAIVAYQLLSGRHPFDFTPAPEAKRLGLQPRPIRGLKRREWRALQRGLAFDRDQRTPHAAEFLRDLEGSQRAWRIAAGLALMLLLTGGYVVYERVQTTLQERPAIAFEQLPAAAQADFRRYMEDAATLDALGDPGSALALYVAAYRLHPRNPDAVRGITSLFERLVSARLGIASPEELTVMRDNLQSVMATDEFLATRPALIGIQRRLDRGLE
jgi:predicted Ser/Thr protein kinase